MLEKRILKIYNNGSNSTKEKRRTCLSLQGEWLENLGFTQGKKILVEAKEENNQKIITIKLLED